MGNGQAKTSAERSKDSRENRKKRLTELENLETVVLELIETMGKAPTTMTMIFIREPHGSAIDVIKDIETAVVEAYLIFYLEASKGEPHKDGIMEVASRVGYEKTLKAIDPHPDAMEHNRAELQAEIATTPGVTPNAARQVGRQLKKLTKATKKQ